MRNSPVKDRLVNVFMSNPQISIAEAAIEADCSPSYAHKILSELRAPIPDYVEQKGKNTFDSYDTESVREDLRDVIYNISPTETPFGKAMPFQESNGKAEDKKTGLLTAWQCGALGLICFAAGGLLGAIKCL